MIDVLNISIPFFALIFLGFGAHAIGFIDAAGARTMSRFAFYVTLPPYMFLKVSASKPSSILNWGFVWRYESGTIIMYLTAAAIGYWLFRLKRLESGIFGLNVAYPNYGYMGIPLAILAFGDAAALPMALILFADTIVLLALTSCFVAGNDGGVTESMKRIAGYNGQQPAGAGGYGGAVIFRIGSGLAKNSPAIWQSFSRCRSACCPFCAWCHAIWPAGAGGGGRSDRHFPVKADCSPTSGRLFLFGDAGSRPALDQGCNFIELPAGCRKCFHACQSLWCLYGAHGIGHSGQHGFCQHHRASLFILVVLWARLTCQTKALAAMQPPCGRCATYRLAGRLHACQHFYPTQSYDRVRR